jgi:hypothetical protein
MNALLSQKGMIPFPTIKTPGFLAVLIGTLKTLKSCFRVKNSQNLPHKIDVKLRRMQNLPVREI